MKIKKDYYYIAAVVILLIIIDQAIKMAVICNVKDNSIQIVQNILKFTYIENTGGAFSLGSGNLISIVITNVVVLAIIFKFMISQIDRMDKITKTLLCLVIAGGIGNLIDRIFRGFVIDYIDINQIIKFPVFNLADIYIVIGWAILIIITIKYTLIKEKK